jgi:hypothetical protein
VQAKVQHDQKWTRKSAMSVRAAEIVGTILSSTEPAIVNVAVVRGISPGKLIRQGGGSGGIRGRRGIKGGRLAKDGMELRKIIISQGLLHKSSSVKLVG